MHRKQSYARVCYLSPGGALSVLIGAESQDRAPVDRSSPARHDERADRLGRACRVATAGRMTGRFPALRCAFRRVLPTGPGVGGRVGRAGSPPSTPTWSTPWVGRPITRRLLNGWVLALVRLVTGIDHGGCDSSGGTGRGGSRRVTSDAACHASRGYGTRWRPR
jgi:hypothetical protein